MKPVQSIEIIGAFDVPTTELAQTPQTLCGYGHWTTNLRADGVVAIVPHELLPSMPEPHSELVRRDHSNDSYFFYCEDPATIDQETGRLAHYRGLLLNNLSNHEDGAILESGIPVTPGEVAAQILRFDPQDILIYTGAGISSCQDDGVWTYDTLCDVIGFSEKATNAAQLTRNMQFIHSFIGEKSIALHSMASLQSFASQLTQSNATKAHHALAGIVHLLEGKPLVATTNIDHLHSQTGITAPYIYRYTTDGPIAFHDHHRGFDTQLRERVPHVKLILVIGKSADNRHLIEHIQSENPDVTCIAVNIADAGLPYMRRQDLLLAGDCQVTLPSVLRELQGIL